MYRLSAEQRRRTSATVRERRARPDSASVSSRRYRGAVAGGELVLPTLVSLLAVDVKLAESSYSWSRSELVALFPLQARSDSRSPGVEPSVRHSDGRRLSDRLLDRRLLLGAVPELVLVVLLLNHAEKSRYASS